MTTKTRIRGIVREANGTYSFVIDVARSADGKRRQTRRRGFSTLKEADAARRGMLRAQETGTYVEPSRLTLGTFLEQWCGGLAGRGVRPSTIASYRANLRLHVVPRLGGVPLQRITAGDLNALYATLLAGGRVDGEGGLSSRTVRYIATIVGAALSSAARQGLVVRNVAEQADPPSARSTRAPEPIVWEASDLRRFLDAIVDERLAVLFRVLAMTGMRRGEALGLSWRAVDLDGACLSVIRTIVSVNGKRQASTPKTGAGRRNVDLDPCTVSALREHRRTQVAERLHVGPGYSDGDYVFADAGGHPYDPALVTRTFSRLVRRLGLPTTRLHDLRHLHATLALGAGVPVKVVSSRLGHTSAAFTLDRYGHVLPGAGADAAAKVAGLIGEVV